LLKFSTYFAFYYTHFAFNYTRFACHDEVMLHKFASMAASGLRFKNALVGSEWATTELDPNPKAKN